MSESQTNLYPRGDECPPRVAVTQAQRDALLDACTDEVELADEGEPFRAAVRMMPTTTALADDLVLPDATGTYWIVSVPRESLVRFLEHQLMLALESGVDSGRLCLWDTCVRLLDVMGHQVDGSIYARIDCHCPECDRRAVLWARLEADSARADGDEELRALGQQYLADLADEVE